MNKAPYLVYLLFSYQNWHLRTVARKLGLYNGIALELLTLKIEVVPILEYVVFLEYH